MADTTELWVGEGLKFQCTQCGNCCTGPSGYVWFNDREGEAIAAHLGLDQEQFRRSLAHTVKGHWTLNEQWNSATSGYDCVFLRREAQTGKALCSIYPVRPTQCRTWPFWPENLQNRAAWQRAARHCPGMNKGKTVPLAQVRILRDSTPDL